MKSIITNRIAPSLSPSFFSLPPVVLSFSLSAVCCCCCCQPVRPRSMIHRGRTESLYLLPLTWTTNQRWDTHNDDDDDNEWDGSHLILYWCAAARESTEVPLIVSLAQYLSPSGLDTSPSSCVCLNARNIYPKGLNKKINKKNGPSSHQSCVCSIYSWNIHQSLNRLYKSDFFNLRLSTISIK